MRNPFRRAPVSALELVYALALALAAYGAVAAVIHALTAPPFGPIFGLPRWTLYTLFAMAGLALTSTILMFPLFFALALILRRGGEIGAVRLALAGLAAGGLAAVGFALISGASPGRLRESAEFGAAMYLPLGAVLAFWTQVVIWLRRALRGA